MPWGRRCYLSRKKVLFVLSAPRRRCYLFSTLKRKVLSFLNRPSIEGRSCEKSGMKSLKSFNNPSSYPLIDLRILNKNNSYSYHLIQHQHWKINHPSSYYLIHNSQINIENQQLPATASVEFILGLSKIFCHNPAVFVSKM